MADWVLGMLIALVVVALFLVLRPLTGNGVGFASALLFLLVLLHEDYYQGGNFTEIYALLPQVLTLGAAGWYFRSGRRRAVVLLGFLTGLAILCKPTYVGLGVASMLVIGGRELLDRRWRSALARLGLFAVGLLLPLGMVAAYWGVRGGLASLWDAVFVYATDYVLGALSLRSLYVTFRNLAESAPMASLTVLCLAGMGLIASRLSPLGRKGRRPIGLEQGAAIAEFSTHSIPRQDWVLGVSLLAVPLEWFLVALPGQNYGHYFITPLPAMAVPVAHVLHRLWQERPGPKPAEGWWLASALLVGGLVLSAVVLGVARDGPQRYQWVSFLRATGMEAIFRLLRWWPTCEVTPSRRTPFWFGGTLRVSTSRRGARAPSRYLFATQVFKGTAESGARLEKDSREPSR